MRRLDDIPIGILGELGSQLDHVGNRADCGWRQTPGTEPLDLANCASTARACARGRRFGLGQSLHILGPCGFCGPWQGPQKETEKGQVLWAWCSAKQTSTNDRTSNCALSANRESYATKSGQILSSIPPVRAAYFALLSMSSISASAVASVISETPYCFAARAADWPSTSLADA